MRDLEDSKVFGLEFIGANACGKHGTSCFVTFPGHPTLPARHIKRAYDEEWVDLETVNAHLEQWKHCDLCAPK